MERVGDALMRKYELVGMIGEGTYGRVYKAISRNASPDTKGVTYAIKMIKRSPSGKDTVTSLATLREIKLLRELNHENVVNLTDVVIDPVEQDVALVMQFASWTLESVIDHHRINQLRIPSNNLRSMIYQCLNGLEFLHRNWILHRDLKPQNILLIGDGPKRGTLQLADLGLARIFKSPTLPLSRVDKVVVTLWYRSPELLLGSMHYTTAVDIWSLGCIFMELFMAHMMNADVQKGHLRAPRALFQGNQQPKQGTFEESQVLKIIQTFGVPDNSTWAGVEQLGHYKEMKALVDKMKNKMEFPDRKRDISVYFTPDQSPARDLLSRMLEMNPAKRISATEALDHHYLKSLQTSASEISFQRNCLDNPKDTRSSLDYDRPNPKPLEPCIDMAQREFARNNRSSG